MVLLLVSINSLCTGSDWGGAIGRILLQIPHPLRVGIPAPLPDLHHLLSPHLPLFLQETCSPVLIAPVPYIVPVSPLICLRIMRLSISCVIFVTLRAYVSS